MKQPITGCEVLGKEYLDKKVYAMKENMLSLLAEKDNFHKREKRAIEQEFHRELKSNKAALKSIKETRTNMFVENHEKHMQIERLNEIIEVSASG